MTSIEIVNASEGSDDDSRGDDGGGDGEAGNDGDRKKKNTHQISHENLLVDYRGTSTGSSSSCSNNIDLAHNKQPALMTHHECNSNQSGSDSGLGYTNSLSSENNSLLANCADEPNRPSGNVINGGLDAYDDTKDHKAGGTDTSGEKVSLCETSNVKIPSVHHGGKSFPLPYPNSFPATKTDLNNNSNQSGNNATFVDTMSNSTTATTTTTTITTTTTTNSSKGNENLLDNGCDSNTENILPFSLSPASRAVSESHGPASQLGRLDSETGSNNAKALAAHHHHHDHLQQQPQAHPNHDQHEETASSASAPQAEAPTQPPRPPPMATAKIKHSAKHGPRELNSTPEATFLKRAHRAADSCDDNHAFDDELDKISKESHDPKVGAAAGSRDCATESKHAANLAQHPHAPPAAAAEIGPVVGTPPQPKSCIRRPDAKSTDKHHRNVSFNQTVIVFCEEIEASSPSDTFEPPLGYQDPASYDRDDANDYANSTTAGADPQDVYAADDLEILSKIMDEDASNMTDDQLIGLLEDGSLLKGIQLTNVDKLTINRMNPDHGYLCHDAISDSDSESSLATREGEELPSLKVQRYAKASSIKEALVKGSRETATPALDRKVGGDIKLKSAVREDTRSDQRVTQSQSLPESQLETIPRSQQISMPARVRVSTVDAGKRSQQQAAHENNQVTSNLAQNAPAQANQQKKVVLIPMVPQSSSLSQSSNLGTKTPNQEMSLPAPDARRTIQTPSTSSGVLDRGAGNLEGGQSNMSKPTSIKGKPITVTSQQDQHPIEMLGFQHTQAGALRDTQVKQMNSACHVCRAIESNRSPTGAIQSARAPLAANQDSQPIAPNVDVNQVRHAAQVQILQNQHHTSPAGESGQTRQHQQKQPQQTSPACVSCHEISLLQQHQHQQLLQHLQQQQQQQQQKQQQQIYAPQTMRLVPASSLGQQRCQSYQIAGQQPTDRPISYQLVYVVDQHGNRIRALQVLRPRQANVTTVGAPQPHQATPNLTGIGGCRLPNQVCITNAQNVVQVSRPPAYEPAQLSIPGGQLLAGSARIVGPVDQKQSMASNLNANSGQLPLMTNQVGPKTVYYVRQSLDMHDSRQLLGVQTRTAPRSFPDAHEVRRLDGLRAQPSNLTHMTHGGLQQQQQQQQNNNNNTGTSYARALNSGKDDIDDPTFGFSRRPAVKVVANAKHDSRVIQGRQNAAGPGQNGYNVGTCEQRSTMLTGSHTLDRRDAQRDISLQRGARENMPTTSSMSSINRALLRHDGDPRGRDANFKDLEFRRAIGSGCDLRQRTAVPLSSNSSQLKQDTTSIIKPEVAYVSNI